MKAKNTKFLIPALAVVLVVLVAVFVFMLRSPSDPGAVPATITEVTLDEVPEEVKAEMESTIYVPGAYYYSFGEEYYVLLTAGELSGYRMSVSYEVNEDNEADFSIQLLEANTEEPVLLYKVYKTTAVAVNANKGALMTPTLEVGAVGLNEGFIRPNGDDYSVYPIMDQSINNALFRGDRLDSKLEAGFYSYQFEIASDGFYLLSATPMTEIQETGYLDSYTATGEASITFSEGGPALEVQFDPNDADILNGLAAMEKNDGQNGWFTLKVVDGQPVISSLDTLVEVVIEYDREGGSAEAVAPEQSETPVLEDTGTAGEIPADDDTDDETAGNVPASGETAANGETNPGDNTNTEVDAE